MTDLSIEVYDVSKESEVALPSAKMAEWLNDLHKASLIGLVEVGLVDHASAKQIASGIEQVIKTHDAPSKASSLDYLDFEKRMTKIIGPVASLLHIGRSRQDIRSTGNKFIARSILRSTVDAICRIRANIIEVSKQHLDTVIPAYTHGVPAQPTTFAHYLMAFGDSFERHVERLEEAYARVNLSPLGAEVNTTSRFKLDRDYLAKLLGFDGIVENAYDANHAATVDALLEVSQLLSLICIQVSQWMQDLNTFHMTSRPWIQMSGGRLMGISSAMPQKRNPRALEYVRELGAIVMGQAHTFTFLARNMNTGMIDVRESALRMPDAVMAHMLSLVEDIIPAIHINKEVARQECSQDYSTMINVADTLFEKYAVPFRVGHHFASLLTDYGRSHGIFPLDIPYVEAQKIYATFSEDALPLTDIELTEALDPVSFIKSRKGTGGPQEAEMLRMIQSREERLAADVERSTKCKDKINKAGLLRESEFSKLLHYEAAQNGKTNGH